MKESYLWQTLRQGLPLVQWTRIESSAGSGVPDCNGFFEGVEVWLELKIMRGLQLEFRQSQAAWIGARLRAGGDVFVLTRRKSELLLYHGSVALLEPKSVYPEKKTFRVDPGTPLLVLKKPFAWPQVWACLADRSRSRKIGEG